MKYSILLPYYKRPELKFTLTSFLHHYSNRSDYEVIIVEDVKDNEDDHKQLVDIISQFENKINIICFMDMVKSYCTPNKYNMAFEKSTGQFVVLSSPEVVHKTNILKGLDGEFNNNANNYIVCSCKFLPRKKDGKPDVWYQHSKYRNKLYNFCSALSRQNYINVGGFDTRYCNGIGFEDNNFKMRIMISSINIKIRDDLVTMHMEHDKEYQKDKALYQINKDLFASQCSNNSFLNRRYE